MRSQGINIILAVSLTAIMILLPEVPMVLLRRAVDIMVALQLIRDLMKRK
jgi:hypothetical protein